MKIAITAVAVFALTCFAFCEQETDPRGDYHVTADSEHALYISSALAHGHRHGYEEGFHVADQDVHMGRTARSLDKVPKDGLEYRDEFGDKKLYEIGYDMGYRAGYDDSYNGREFRPTVEVLNAQINDVSDETLRAGYNEGLNAARESGSTELSAGEMQACHAKRRNARFCDGFALGFVIRRDLPDRLSAQNGAHGGHR